MPWCVIAHVLIFDGEFKTSAIGELANSVAIDFLPGGLMNEVRLFPIFLSLSKFFIADEDIGGAGVKVYANSITGLKIGEATTYSGFG